MASNPPPDDASLGSAYEHGREHGAIDGRLDELEKARARLWKAIYVGGTVIAGLLVRWAANWFGF